MGVTLNGPLDSAGFLVPLDDAGLPTTTITVLVEVKNIRSWIYPQSIELYQVLDKAVTLQQRHPGQLILPVLACRRAHKTTFWMASQLGFMVVSMDRQYVDKVDPDDLLEIRNELHFQDLYVVERSARIHDRFRTTVPDQAAEFANNWAATCADPDSANLLHHLHHITDQTHRAALMDELRTRARLRNKRGGW